mgnify:CR=1 FL=1|jgi:hypothetical protein|tara:strand:- start:1305 stop:1610 length:306 start_codon:yes stop_codon:yes gene_type:complete
MSKKTLLHDPSFLMVLLAALIKKEGGEYVFTEEDMTAVTKSDALGLFQSADREDTFIIKVVSKSDYPTSGIYEYDGKKSTSKSDLKTKYAEYDDVDDEWEN